MVVPCYNYGRFLPDCVDSVLGQSGVQVRVTVVDDASTDDSAQVARRIVDADPRVRLIRHETNAGHIATYNDGLAQVDSDYVVLLSADDLLAPGALARAGALLEAHPSVGLAYGRPRDFQGAPPGFRPRAVDWSLWQGSRWIELQFKRGNSALFSPEAVVRTSVQHAVGYYDPRQPHAGDVDMWLRIASVSDVGHVNGPDHAFRRVHGAAMSQNHFATMVGDVGQRVEAYRAHLGRLDPGPARDHLEAVMIDRAVEEALSWVIGRVRDGAPLAEVEPAVQFVHELDPRVERRGGWRAFRAIADGGSPWHLGAAWTWRHSADLRDRLRWRTWNRWGM